MSGCGMSSSFSPATAENTAGVVCPRPPARTVMRGGQWRLGEGRSYTVKDTCL